MIVFIVLFSFFFLYWLVWVLWNFWAYGRGASRGFVMSGRKVQSRPLLLFRSHPCCSPKMAMISPPSFHLLEAIPWTCPGTSSLNIFFEYPSWNFSSSSKLLWTYSLNLQTFLKSLTWTSYSNLHVEYPPQTLSNILEPTFQTSLNFSIELEPHPFRTTSLNISNLLLETLPWTPLLHQYKIIYY